jgi:DNA-binding transcriptional ArsR family regulator
MSSISKTAPRQGPRISRPRPCRRGSGIFNRAVDDPRVATDDRAMPPAAEHPPDAALDAIFAALADPTRRAILTMLLEDDMAVTDVAEPFAMSLAAISKHLAVLAGAGLIRQDRRGRVKWCKLDPDAMRAASIWIQGFGLFDPVDLDALERFLSAELDGADGGGPEVP